jgi:hypothetical protein
MTAISQKISNLIGGISQQPDERQLPGSVKDALNVIPDVKGLLAKRPGSKLVGTLSDYTEGQWHHYFRDDNEQYFMRVRPDGQVDVWDALNGTPRLVTYTETPIELGEEGGLASDDAEPVCDTCNPDTFQTATNNLQTATVALQDAKSRIEQINVIIEKGEYTAPMVTLDQLEEEKEQIEGNIPTLLANYNTALAAYETAVEPCGIYNNPYSRALRNNCGGENLLPYLRHENDEEIQMVTVNDFTFVVNRKQVANMVERSKPDDQEYGVFFYLDQLAFNQVYTLNYYDNDTSNNQTTEVTVPNQIGLASSTASSANGTFGSASDAVTRTARGVTYRLSVVRQQVLEAEPDGGDDYDTIWRATVQLLAVDSAAADLPGNGDTIETVSLLGQNWTVRVTGTGTQLTSADSSVSAGPYISGQDALSGNTILNELATDLEGLGLTTEVIGNGVWVTSDEPFSLDTPDESLITVINGKVNNPSLLPTQCKDGFIVKIVNSFVEEDDYYVIFRADSDNSGSGFWEETVSPDVDLTIDPDTMPHQIRRLSDGTFEVSPIKWTDRQVGDDVTNPVPSFINQTINKVMFFRNRMVILSGENVIMSRPNLFYDFFAKTAQTVTAADPIDLSVSSTFPAILYDGLETAAGLMLLSMNQQFLVVTDNTDVFSPLTANIKSIGTYKYNTKVRPVHMGQTVGFLNDAGYRSRFFELVPSRDLDYEAIETSKPVDQLIPSDIDLIADSKDDNMLALAEKEADDRNVWVYRYFTQGDRRVQSAWFRWQLSGEILYHAIMDDKYYAVLSVETGNETTPRIVTLQAFDLKIDRQSILIKLAPDMRQYDYQVHMDNYFMVTPSEMTYNAQTKSTTWRLPIGFHSDLPVVAYELEMDHKDMEGYIVTGRFTELTTVGVENGVQATAPGRWDRSNVLCGFNFDMEVQMPTIYVTKTKGQNSVVADTTDYLTLHRAIVSFDVTGMVDTVVKRKGREDYTIKYESSIQDGYIADTSAVEQNSQKTIPIYDKNVNTDIYLKSSHPTPTSVVSLTWEGDYNNRNYKRG